MSSKVVDLGTNRKRVLVSNNIVTLILYCPVSEILQVSGEERPQPYSTRRLGVFALDEIADVVAPRCEDPKLIIRVISFELTQHIRPRYINVTDGQTDGRTDGRLSTYTIAISRFALRDGAVTIQCVC